MEIIFVVVVLVAVVGVLFLRGFVAVSRRRSEQFSNGINQSQVLGQPQRLSSVADEPPNSRPKKTVAKRDAN
jgi:hypothetical protein